MMILIVNSIIIIIFSLLKIIIIILMANVFYNNNNEDDNTEDKLKYSLRQVKTSPGFVKMSKEEQLRAMLRPIINAENVKLCKRIRCSRSHNKRHNHQIHRIRITPLDELNSNSNNLFQTFSNDDNNISYYSSYTNPYLNKIRLTFIDNNSTKSNFFDFTNRQHQSYMGTYSLGFTTNKIIKPELNNVDLNLLCFLCLKLMNNPAVCYKCDTRFCKECLVNFALDKQRCPKCYHIISPYLVKDINLIEEYANTLVKCNYPGCQEQYSLLEIRSHMETCVFKETHDEQRQKVNKFRFIRYEDDHYVKPHLLNFLKSLNKNDIECENKLIKKRNEIEFEEDENNKKLYEKLKQADDVIDGLIVDFAKITKETNAKIKKTVNSVMSKNKKRNNSTNKKKGNKQNIMNATSKVKSGIYSKAYKTKI